MATHENDNPWLGDPELEDVMYQRPGIYHKGVFTGSERPIDARPDPEDLVSPPNYVYNLLGTMSAQNTIIREE